MPITLYSNSSADQKLSWDWTGLMCMPLVARERESLGVANQLELAEPAEQGQLPAGMVGAFENNLRKQIGMSQANG